MTTQQPNSWKENAFYSKQEMLEDTDIETHIYYHKTRKLIKEINISGKYLLERLMNWLIC